MRLMGACRFEKDEAASYMKESQDMLERQKEEQRLQHH